MELGDIDSTPNQFFKEKFLDPLRVVLDMNPGSIAILVPSVRDMISHHAVYPQCELEKVLSGGDHVRSYTLTKNRLS